MNMGDKKQKQNQNEDIPIDIIHALDEHTVGGYMLFYFNQKDGNPAIRIRMDSQVHTLALQKYVTDWLESLRELQIEQNMCNMSDYGDASNEEDSD